MRCPANTYGCTDNNCNGIQTCFCEEHCSWETCRLVEGPKKCVKGVKSEWIWDLNRLIWVAQRRGMQTEIIPYDTHLIIFLLDFKYDCMSIHPY